ncbi:MAG: hypothetical protein HN580_13425, partial [Deltaproteobacteria bacterium]|nr:hypothetical protein [Deltaproteobacteria bacterium]
MSRYDEMKALLEAVQFNLNPKSRGSLRILTALGVVAFVVGLIGGYHQQVWQALLVN